MNQEDQPIPQSKNRPIKITIPNHHKARFIYFFVETIPDQEWAKLDWLPQEDCPSPKLLVKVLLMANYLQEFSGKRLSLQCEENIYLLAMTRQERIAPEVLNNFRKSKANQDFLAKASLYFHHLYQRYLATPGVENLDFQVIENLVAFFEWDLADQSLGPTIDPQVWEEYQRNIGDKIKQAILEDEEEAQA